jgi:hypothetical protein
MLIGLAAALPSLAALPHEVPPPPKPLPATVPITRPSPALKLLLGWISTSGDNQGEPFAVIDKPHARLYVFDADGTPRGNAPVLLGLAKGDDTVPGIGDKPLSQVKVSERTTPAGRFVAEHGTNMRGEHVVWIDYEAAVSMHPVLTTNPKEHRLQRLATPGVADNRISYGCVNVPTAFFADNVLATLTSEHPVVYVLPDVKPLHNVFAQIANPPPTTASTRRGSGMRQASVATVSTHR